MKLRENIYTGENNNKINKRKYKKHSMSPFVSLDAGNVNYNISAFNRAMGSGESTSESAAMGESLLEDIASTKRQYSHIPEDDFYQIIALDPTFNSDRDSVGKYGKWLLGLYKKDNPLNYSTDDEGNTITDLLATYDKFKNDRNYQIEKDINKFKSFKDLNNAINSVSSTELSARQKERELRTSKDYKVVYKDKDWTIYVPLSYAGSCTLGKGTSWCTAYSEDDGYYNKYTKQGPLYILINNNDKSEKYQFHFESEQFMDKDDHDIDLHSFIDKYPEVGKFFNLSNTVIFNGSFGDDSKWETTLDFATNLIIDNNVTEIDDHEFDNMNFISVEMADSVVKIGDCAFQFNKNLEHIKLSNSLKSIGYAAFFSCGLKSIKIPSSVEYIDEEAFASCDSLELASLPDSITIITTSMFYDCSSLNSIKLPSSVTKIDSYAFANCPLKSIEIPDKVKFIGINAFSECEFRSIKIPDSVKIIDDSAFLNTPLIDITIPKSVEHIGINAFGNYFVSLKEARIVRLYKGSYAEQYFKDYPNFKIEYINDTNESLNESSIPTYTFSYKGPVYRFERVYTVLKEPIYTTASTAKQAANMIRGKLKNKFGFDYKAKLDIDEDNIMLVDVPDNEYQIFNNKNKQKAEYDDLDLVGTMHGKDIYYINGKYIVDDMEFVSIGEIEDYLEA